MKLTLENIRTFKHSETFEFKPLTLIMGENSSGKSTVLATLSAALNRDFPGSSSVFNNPPFELGSFETIAQYRGGKAGRAAEFWIHLENTIDNRPCALSAKFNEIGGNIRCTKVLISANKTEIVCDRQIDSVHVELKVDGVSALKKSREISNDVELSISRIFRLVQDLSFEVYVANNNSSKEDVANRRHVFEAISQAYMTIDRSTPVVVALSPIRLKPRRTFDDFDDTFRPDGNHIPPKLATLWKQLTEQNTSKKESARAEKIFEQLNLFGSEAGLFDEIDVRRLGKRPSDPFQVRVKTFGPHVNLVDVGYGISQSIPIVAETLLGPPDAVYLVQQPEVHLHPKAQAALGSFFARLVTSSKRHFVIETHSDYLLDRIRREVAEGKLKPEQFQLIYLDKPDFFSRVHHLTLDSLGNVNNAPDSYRKFFLEEDLSLFFRGKRGANR
ncbi:MAG: AAA family ATPase [Burkholderiaceae bacterium]